MKNLFSLFTLAIFFNSSLSAQNNNHFAYSIEDALKNKTVVKQLVLDEICKIPNSISELINLEKLTIRNSPLSSIDSHLFQNLSHLKVLEIQECVVFPKGISNIKTIRTLIVKNNTFKSTISGEKFEGISHLVVWGEFPNNLEIAFPDVQHLFIFNSRITKNFISSEFNLLQNLKSLELYECGNVISLLSQLNVCCPILERLSLSAMPITEIPKSIHYLNNLEEINLYFLDIDLLNPQILNLKNLKKITIQEMSISNMDAIIRICRDKHIILE